MKCERCHEDKDDVEALIDPYRQELYDERVVMDLCPDCYQEQLWDI